MPMQPRFDDDGNIVFGMDYSTYCDFKALGKPLRIGGMDGSTRVWATLSDSFGTTTNKKGVIKAVAAKIVCAPDESRKPKRGQLPIACELTSED